MKVLMGEIKTLKTEIIEGRPSERETFSEATADALVQSQAVLAESHSSLAESQGALAKSQVENDVLKRARKDMES
jgi:hypothetical protein